jgi:predicted membrane protein
MMLKRIAFIFITFILCGTVGSARNVDTETSQDGDNSILIFLLCISIIGLIVCVIVRWKFWNKIKDKKIFYYTVAVFVLILLFSLFKIIRTIVYVAVGILVIILVTQYIMKKQQSEKRKADITFKKEREPESKQEKPKKHSLQTEDLEKVFKRILNDDKDFNVILKNEQFCLLLIENSLKYPKIRKMLEKEFLPKETDKSSPITISTVEPKTEQPVVITPANSSPTILYADSIFDGFFNKTKETPNEDTIFELHLQNAQVATFTIYVSAYQRIIANPAFLEGCEKQVLNNVQNIEIVKEGTAQCQADGKWKIINRLNVIIN